MAYSQSQYNLKVKWLLVNNFNMILNNQDRLVLNDQSITSPHNESQKSPGFVRSSHQRCSVRKDVLKTFANFTGKHLCWSLFLITLLVFRTATLLKRYKAAINRAAFKTFAIFTGKHLCRSHFLLKLQTFRPATF